MKGIRNIESVKTNANVTMTREQLIESYWTSHPRYIFMKSVPENSRFLELGAGDGGISFWKDWLAPNRDDIKMYGLDLTIGKFADRYEKFEAADLNKARLDFEDNSVDVVYSTHVFEHLSNFRHITAEISRVMRGGGIYI